MLDHTTNRVRAIELHLDGNGPLKTEEETAPARDQTAGDFRRSINKCGSVYAEVGVVRFLPLKY